MRLATLHNRWIASGLLATTVILSFSSVALADHGRGRGNGARYKGVDYRYSAPYSRRVIVERRDSGAGPALAGLIGGFILGTAVARSQPVVVHREVIYSDRDRDCDRGGYRDDSRYGGYREVQYGYYDPYSDDWYDSLDQCRLSARDRGEVFVIRVIDLSSGNCVRTMRYSNNGWQRYDEREWNDNRARNRDWRRSPGWSDRQRNYQRGNSGDHGQWNDDGRDDRRGGDDN